MSTTIRVSDEVRAAASRLAADAGTTVGELVGRALEVYERERFWAQTRRALADNDVLDDEGWDQTVPDGLSE